MSLAWPSGNTYLATRIAVMAGRLLRDEQIAALLSAPLETLGREFGISELLAQGYAQGRINRAVERAMVQTLMGELEVLLRPLPAAGREMLIFWLRKFELYNLKALIRGKIQGQSPELIGHNLLELPGRIGLPHERLLRTENIPELLRLLEDGPYGGIARQARQVYEKMNESFSLDATIDLHYYMGLVKRAQGGDAGERNPLLRLVRLLIDQQNLTWLLRYRFSYHLSPSRTFYLLVPQGLHLHREQLKALVNLDSLEQVVLELPEVYGRPLEGVTSLLDAQRVLDRVTAREVRTFLRFSSSAVARSLAYLVLREGDLLKIRAILQGRVLKLDEALIRCALE